MAEAERTVEDGLVTRVHRDYNAAEQATGDWRG